MKSWENCNEDYYISGEADAGGYGFFYLQRASGIYGQDRSPDEMDPECQRRKHKWTIQRKPKRSIKG